MPGHPPALPTRLAAALHVFVVAATLFIVNCTSVDTESHSPVKVTGTAFDAIDSSALSGVEVRIVGTTSSVVAGPSGTFMVEANAPGEYLYVSIVKNGYRAVTLIFDKNVVDTAIYLRRDRGVVVGSVSGADTTRPPAGAAVVSRSPGDTAAFDSTSTDSLGRFHVNYPASDSPGPTIAVIMPGYVTNDTTFSGAHPGDTISLDMHLRRLHTIGGIVYSEATRKPLDSVVVRCAGQLLMTGADGRFTFAGLTPSDTAHVLQFARNGYGDLTRTVSTVADSAMVTVFMSPSATIAGTIYRAGSTGPLPGAQVRIGDTVVSSDGSGRFVLAGFAPADTPQTISMWADLYDTLSLNRAILPGTTELGTLYLNRLTGSVMMSIRLQGRLDHSGAVVTLWGKGLSDTSDLKGAVAFSAIPTGRYTVDIVKSQFQSLSCAVAVVANDTIVIDTCLTIQSGVILDTVEWFLGNRPYSIVDTLRIAPSGVLILHPGCVVALQNGSRLIADGVLLSRGTRDRPVYIHSSGGERTPCGFQIRGTGGSGPQVRHTQVLDCAVSLLDGPRIESSIFAWYGDGTTPAEAVSMTVWASTDTARVDYCDFVWYNSKKDPIAIRGSNGPAGLAVSNSILYNHGGSAGCFSFVDSATAGGKIGILNSDLYTTSVSCNHLTLRDIDISNVLAVDPGYVDASKFDLRLQTSSALVDKSNTGTFLGSQGIAR